MALLKDLIFAVKQEFFTALEHAHTLDHVEKVRIDFLGRQGKIADLMAMLKELPTDEKKIAGPELNALKQHTQLALDEKIEALKNTVSARQQELRAQFDVTAYRHQELQGSLHIYTQIIERLKDIFISMGYAIADGPEVETEYHNFTALNIPDNHPARDFQDTFWLMQPHMLLRTQTSPVQIRIMEQTGKPVAIFAPGRVYRNEQLDASHEFCFTQGEVLMIGANISVSNLLATARAFLQEIFEKKDLKIRVRPGFFPFVEPGLEIDASCPFCTTGCSTCKKTGWIELMGSGLVHPNVLRMCKIDPEKYSGFAMGFGIERIAMVKYGISDIRLFHGNKVSFLKQF